MAREIKNLGRRMVEAITGTTHVPTYGERPPLPGVKPPTAAATLDPPATASDPSCRTPYQIPEEYAEIYRQRGLPVPAWISGLQAGALIELHHRDKHRRHAYRRGYFWLPCPLCGTEFGGHEITGSIPDPGKGPGTSRMICPFCTMIRNGIRVIRPQGVL